MAWARITDEFHDHHKVTDLCSDQEGLAALGLWTLCLTWVRADRRRQGLIPRGQAVRMGGVNAKQLASRLVDVKLWDETETGYAFHDFQDTYTPGDLSEQRAEAGRKGGKASGMTRRSKQKGSNLEANPKQVASFPEANGFEASRTRAGATTHLPKEERTLASDDAFEAFYAAFPRKKDRAAAAKAWTSALRKPGVTAERLIEAAAGYAKQVASSGTEARFVKYPARWLNAGSYDDAPELPLNGHLPGRPMIENPDGGPSQEWYG